jgi:uncharacterized membrane protein (DUF373 family)
LSSADSHVAREAAKESLTRGAEIIPQRDRPGGPRHYRGDGVITLLIVGIEYAIVISLLFVSAVVLVRTIANFVNTSAVFPRSVIPAVDGILVVIILLDIVHTVFLHLRDATFPVRPFLVIGILAGVRTILSASAYLTLATNLTSKDFNQTLIELGVGVGVVLALLVGLLILRRTGRHEVD